MDFVGPIYGGDGSVALGFRIKPRPISRTTLLYPDAQELPVTLGEVEAGMTKKRGKTASNMQKMLIKKIE